MLFHGLEVHGLEEYAERLRQAGREYFDHVYIQIVCKAHALNGVHEPDADRRKVLRASGETAYNIHRGDIRRRLVHADWYSHPVSVLQPGSDFTLSDSRDSIALLHTAA